MKSAVLAAILNDDKTQILLVKRRDVPVWVLPGGGVDEGESVEKAVCREALEETGLIVAITKKTATFTPINRLTQTTHLFECQPVGGKLSSTDETESVSYFPLNELPGNFFYIHKEMLQIVLENKLEEQHLKLTNVTWSAFFIYLVKHPLLVLRFLLSQAGFPLNAKKKA